MGVISRDELVRHKERGSWRQLESIARQIVLEVSERSGREFKPTLGGGTRLMLDLDHRVSYDIDLFITNPQYIGFISPRLNDNLDDIVSSYDEAGDFIKLAFINGEIDFIVRWPLLGLSQEKSEHTSFALEPIAEVLAKKLYYRGAVLKHRDLFDWWAIDQLKPDAIPQYDIAKLLKDKLDGISSVLSAMERSKNKRAWDEIESPLQIEMSDALSWAKSKVDYLKQLSVRHSFEAPKIDRGGNTPGPGL